MMNEKFEIRYFWRSDDVSWGLSNQCFEGGDNDEDIVCYVSSCSLDENSLIFNEKELKIVLNNLSLLLFCPDDFNRVCFADSEGDVITVENEGDDVYRICNLETCDESYFGEEELHKLLQALTTCYVLATELNNG